MYIDFLFHNATYHQEAWGANYIKFAFGFVDEDNIPELFLCQDSSHSSGVQIYSYANKQKAISYLGEISSFGNLSYYEKQNLMVAQYGGMGYWIHVFEEIQDDGKLHILAIEGTNEGAVGHADAKYYWAFPYPYPEDSAWLFENNDQYLISEEKLQQRRHDFLSEYTSEQVVVNYDEMFEITKANVISEYARITA